MLPLGYEPEFLCHCNLLTDNCICSDDLQSISENQDYGIWTVAFKHQMETMQNTPHLF